MFPVMSEAVRSLMPEAVNSQTISSQVSYMFQIVFVEGTLNVKYRNSVDIGKVV